MAARRGNEPVRRRPFFGNLRDPRMWIGTFLFLALSWPLTMVLRVVPREVHIACWAAAVLFLAGMILGRIRWNKWLGLVLILLLDLKMWIGSPVLSDRRFLFLFLTFCALCEALYYIWLSRSKENLEVPASWLPAISLVQAASSLYLWQEFYRWAPQGHLPLTAVILHIVAGLAYFVCRMLPMQEEPEG